jgi:hypothetical protein
VGVWDLLLLSLLFPYEWMGVDYLLSFCSSQSSRSPSINWHLGVQMWTTQILLHSHLLMLLWYVYILLEFHLAFQNYFFKCSCVLHVRAKVDLNWCHSHHIPMERYLWLLLILRQQQIGIHWVTIRVVWLVVLRKIWILMMQGGIHLLLAGEPGQWRLLLWTECTLCICWWVLFSLNSCINWSYVWFIFFLNNEISIPSLENIVLFTILLSTFLF